jgi:hypothetical protein
MRNKPLLSVKLSFLLTFVSKVGAKICERIYLAISFAPNVKFPIVLVSYEVREQLRTLAFIQFYEKSIIQEMKKHELIHNLNILTIKLELVSQ